MKNKKLKKDYETAVNNYISAFETKHNVLCNWSGVIGDAVDFADIIISFLNLKYIIDNNIPFDYVHDWFFLTVEKEEIYITFTKYCILRKKQEEKK